MTRALVRVALVAMAVLLLVFALEPPTRVLACSCAVPSGVDLSRALTQAEAAAYGQGAVVFTGRAVARRDRNSLRPTFSSADSITWTFAVDGVLHGEAGAVVDVEAARDGASCGMSFEIGARYQVVAGRSGGVLRTGLCSRTMRLAGRSVGGLLSTTGAVLEERRESVAFGLLAVAGLTMGAMLTLGVPISRPIGVRGVPSGLTWRAASSATGVVGVIAPRQYSLLPESTMRTGSIRSTFAQKRTAARSSKTRAAVSAEAGGLVLGALPLGARGGSRCPAAELAGSGTCNSLTVLLPPFVVKGVQRGEQIGHLARDGELVQDFHALTLRLHQPIVLEVSQLMGGRGLRQTDMAGNVLDISPTGFLENVEDR